MIATIWAGIGTALVVAGWTLTATGDVIVGTGCVLGAIVAFAACMVLVD